MVQIQLCLVPLSLRTCLLSGVSTVISTLLHLLSSQASPGTREAVAAIKEPRLLLSNFPVVLIPPFLGAKIVFTGGSRLAPPENAILLDLYISPLLIRLFYYRESLLYDPPGLILTTAVGLGINSPVGHFVRYNISELWSASSFVWCFHAGSSLQTLSSLVMPIRLLRPFL